MIEVLQGAQAQLQDAAHTLAGYLNRTDLDPQRLQALDERLSAWMSLARRYRRPPAELPALLAQWKRRADARSTPRPTSTACSAPPTPPRRPSTRRRAASRRQRRAAAPKLAAAVTQAMQQLGMAGGRFEVALTAQEAPQSFGLESAEFLVAGHAGSTPRPLAKVASGGELSRIALAIAVTTSQLRRERGTLIFDEVDAGVGGAVAETVGRLMKQLGRDRQVLAVTHLPQVAACADHHFVVAKQAARRRARAARSSAVAGEARVGRGGAHARRRAPVGHQPRACAGDARRSAPNRAPAQARASHERAASDHA